MKFRATFSSVGVQWLERFVPVFEKLGKELSVLLTPSTLHLVQDHTASGGLELHADVLREEVFDEYKISSNNEDKIAFHLEPAVLHRVLRGLIGSEATHVEVKLIKRLVAPERSLPFLNFSSRGVVDIVQDVPLAGPLNRRELARLETLVKANVVGVPYWLNLDKTATEATQQAVERFRAVGPVVELATTRAGALHVSVGRAGFGAAELGTELRGAPVLPAAERRPDPSEEGAEDETGEESGGEPSTSASERLAAARAAGIAALVRVATRQLWKSLLGMSTDTDPTNCLVGVAGGGGHVELVFRYDRQAIHGNDAVGLMVRLPVEEDDDVMFEEDR